METYVSLLQSVPGRDKVMRATGYGAVLLSGIFNANSSTRLLTLAKHISSARIILRLFEDIPALKSTLKWGCEELDLTSRVCTVVSNVAMQMFYLSEHLAWAGDAGLVPLKRTKSWWTTNVICWIVSLLSNLAKSFRKIQLLKDKRRLLLRQHEIFLLEGQSSKSSAHGKDGLKAYEERMTTEVLNLVKNFFDFVIAVSMLPWKGFLWAGKSTPKRNALFGLISSVASILVVLRGTREVKKD